LKSIPPILTHSDQSNVFVHHSLLSSSLPSQDIGKRLDLVSWGFRVFHIVGGFLLLSLCLIAQQSKPMLGANVLRCRGNMRQQIEAIEGRVWLNLLNFLYGFRDWVDVPSMRCCRGHAVKHGSCEPEAAVTGMTCGELSIKSIAQNFYSTSSSTQLYYTNSMIDRTRTTDFEFAIFLLLLLQL